MIVGLAQTDLYVCRLMLKIPSVQSSESGNGVIDALNSEKIATILANGELVEISRGAILFSPHEAIEYAYFPTEGMVSLVLGLSDGAMVEIGVVGAEGLVGWPAMIGLDAGTLEAVVQIHLTAYRFKTATLLQLAQDIPGFSEAMLRSRQGLFLQVAQSAACNQRHSSAERLAKWLLLADDRSQGHTINLSQEFLAMMLGIRRAGVTVAMGDLRRKGCVTNGHGRITIINRARLEASACECYTVLKREGERLAPATKPPV
jgi:CRP-like cAMP-binding protein